MRCWWISATATGWAWAGNVAQKASSGSSGDVAVTTGSAAGGNAGVALAHRAGTPCAPAAGVALGLRLAADRVRDVRTAKRVVRRHRLAERFLTDILGLSWASAHHEAGKWEHVMSEEVEEAMIARLGNPTTCPHGNPIPGSDYLAPDHVRLVDVAPGTRFVVTRIPEELEFVPGMLEFLERSRLVPGSSGLVRRLDEDGTMLVAVDDEDVNLDPRASARILVTR
jgi:hypothetical protein